MAITRKRKEPSAGTDESSENYREDGSPSKKTATKGYNVKSSERLPLPKSCPVPVITMILLFREQKQSIRVLLDTGSTVPILTAQFTLNQWVPVAKREIRRTIQDYVGRDVNGGGALFTSPLLLQHRQHFSQVVFEVAPLVSDYDAILAPW